jgi:hypothetical protein
MIHSTTNRLTIKSERIGQQINGSTNTGISPGTSLIMTEQHKTRKRAMSVFPRVTVPDGNSVPGDNKQGVSINTSNPQKLLTEAEQSGTRLSLGTKKAHTALKIGK